MKPSSAKAKGRRYQYVIRDEFLKYAPSLEPDDIRSNPMGASGEDLLFSPAARKVYPYSVECKRSESLNIYKTINQAESNCNGHIPLIVFRKTNLRSYVALPLEDFMQLIKESNPEVKDDF
ncbi:hypothetical protein KAR91_24715 [Candidatus Pacearchaeota archaeon]|nr:hypothetical protein [Candidatus Pacearchaeota archaeon]